jgi:signal transduction histidine kinase
VARTAAELNRKQADEALRESEQRYHAYVQLNPDACWRIEFSEPIDTALPEKEQLDKVLQFGYVAECNSAFLRRLGLQEAGKIIGATIAEAVPYLQNVDRYINSLIHSGYRYNTIEITRVDARGRRSHSLTSHWGIVEDGKLQRIWGSSRDITELREVEAQFRQAQKFESIGTLAAGIAHDFKNVLMVILGYSSQLLAQTNTDDPAHAELATIQKAANQGAGLADQLLTFSRKPTGEMRLIDLNSLVQGDEQTLRRLLGPKVELVIEVETAPALVRACPGYMHQVLLNLTLNARDAMPNGGRLIVAVSSMDIDEDRPPQLAAIEPGRYVRLSVADNGTGMTPEVEERMFEPFFTTKAERGTGLGLPTVYGIVRQAGGHIQVKTAPNKGATIEIFLPEQSQSNAPIKDA